MEDKVIVFFSTAINCLKNANEELCRPEEDIVPHVVCKNSQSAIDNFLKGFLVLKGGDTNHYETVDALYEQCLLLNKNIKTITSESFECGLNKIDSAHCNEVTKVSQCHEIADRLESFLRLEGILK
jgi:hypothetical protein